MKTLFSEDYYRSNWERFIKRVPGEHYMNLEEKLERTLETYKGLPVEAIEAIKLIEAKKIIETTTELLKKEMFTIQSLETGKSSLGYTTQSQEIQARSELRQRFEFNCLQLADFKKKYN